MAISKRTRTRKQKYRVFLYKQAFDEREGRGEREGNLCVAPIYILPFSMNLTTWRISEETYTFAWSLIFAEYSPVFSQ